MSAPAPWAWASRGTSRSIDFPRLPQHVSTEVDHLLIVPIHKIDHHPFDAPGTVKRKGSIQVSLGRFPMHPKAEPYAFAPRVADHLGQIYIRKRLGDVGAFVRNDGPAVPGGVLEAV